VAAAPELAALIRLHDIGVEVNRFQMKELEECSGMQFSVSTEKIVGVEGDGDTNKTSTRMRF